VIVDAGSPWAGRRPDSRVSSPWRSENRVEFDTDTIVDELRTLRKGLGAQTAKIGEQVGPALRAVCRIGNSDSQATIRSKLVRVLGELCSKTPDHL